MFTLNFLDSFNESYGKFIRGNKELQKRIDKSLRFLRQDPLYPSLKSHKVNTRNYGEKWSSWITGDLRIIWDFDENNQLTIFLFDITTHTGTHREYK